MTWLLLASALAGEVLTLPHGRVAVITPDEAPTQLVVSAPGVLSVTAAQPHLLVLGKNPGRSTLGLVHDGGRRDWTVEVSSDPATPIAGSYVAEVPTAPIPTSGMTYHLPADCVQILPHVTVEEAMRTIISCGSGSAEMLANNASRAQQKVEDYEE